MDATKIRAKQFPMQIPSFQIFETAASNRSLRIKSISLMGADRISNKKKEISGITNTQWIVHHLDVFIPGYIPPRRRYLPRSSRGKEQIGFVVARSTAPAKVAGDRVRTILFFVLLAGLAHLHRPWHIFGINIAVYAWTRGTLII